MSRSSFSNKVVETIYFIPWRFYSVLGCILLLICGLLLRTIELAIFYQPFLQQQGNQRILRLVNTPAFRGVILDRNGFPLAVSTKVYSIWINPKAFFATHHELVKLAQLLQWPLNSLQKKINVMRQSPREFMYLKRNLEPALAQQIKALQLSGLYTQESYRRYYPEGEVTAHIIGFTNIDDDGQEGLELAYNDWLQGEAGKKWVIKDRLGRTIDDMQTVRQQKRGHDLQLSINRQIQYLAYRTLLKGVIANQAASGSAVVLDVKTGEILAMVNQPGFNPNTLGARQGEAIRNRAVTDTFEPGSTMKAFTVASALESGKFQPDARINTSPGWMRLDHHLVRDERNYGILSLAQILQVSSNMGAARLALSLPTNALYGLLHRFGFGEVTAVGFPGEASGVLSNNAQYGDFSLATMSFGYGITVTTLQLARAYAILANGGVALPMTLLKAKQINAGIRILDEKIAKQVVNLLETVVDKGAGKNAKIPGFRVAGKTGTAFKAGNQGYQAHHYISSFVGLAPVINPRLVVAVVIHDPQGKAHLGAQVSAPIFKTIMEGALRVLAIAPDK